MNSFLHSRFTETLGWMLVYSLWQLTLIGAFCAALLAVLRQATANFRYVVACSGLLLMLAVPVATYVHMLPPVPSAAVALSAAAPELSGERPNSAIMSVVGARHRPPADSMTVPWTVWLKSAIRPWLPTAVACYLAGMSLLFLRLAAGYARLRRLVRAATPITGSALQRLQMLARQMGVHRPLRLLESVAIEVPALLGTLKPVILLPAAALAGLSTDQLSALLAHELAHIRRHDYLLNLAQSLIETLLFYHPAAWWLSARIRQEREHCCDDVAIAATSTPLAYAQALAAMESLRVPGTLALAAGGGRLLPRIRRILAPAPARQPRLLTTSTAALFIALLTALIYLGCNPTASPPALATSVATAPTTQPISLEIQIVSMPASAFASALETALFVTLSPVTTPGTKPIIQQFDASNPQTLARLMEVIQIAHQSTIIAKPKLKVNSGEPASIEIGQEIPYIKGYQENAGENGAPPKFIPDVVYLRTGIHTDVTATVNGAKITTAFHPKITMFRGYDTIATTGPAHDLPIQSPRTTVAELQTTVNIPDGGTIAIVAPAPPFWYKTQSFTPGVLESPDIPSTNPAPYYQEGYTLLYILHASTAAASSQPAGLEDTLKDTTTDDAVRRHLEETGPALSADSQPLDPILELLSARSGVTITVNWDALHAAGIEKTTPVTLHEKPVPYHQLLTTLLIQINQVKGNIVISPSNATPSADRRVFVSVLPGALVSTVENGGITITTKADREAEAEKHPIVRAYDIRDLLQYLPAGTTTQSQVNTIMDTIRSRIMPESWMDHGGTVGTIHEMSGQLIVRQTVDNQKAVADELQILRDKKSGQIALETRVYILSNNFLDDFRIGWNVRIPTTGLAEPPPVLNASIIDDQTLSQLMNMAQADRRSITWTQPRVTLIAGRTERFDLSAPKSTALSTAQPAVGNPAPASLDLSAVPKLAWNLTPTLSQDRRYVILKIDNTTVSIPPSGTLLVNAGPVKIDPAESASLHPMLILVRPTLMISP